MAGEPGNPGDLGARSQDDEDEVEFVSKEDAEEAVRAIGQTPMLESVQGMLLQQQQKELREKELAMEEFREDLRRAQKERETLGVNLYGLQQQLAALQVNLEAAYNNFGGTNQSRLEAEQLARERKQALMDYEKEVQVAEEKLKAAQAEENAVKAAVRQVAEFLEETKEEIAVMRRATHKTEETVSDLERKKQEQDLFIDKKVAKVRQLEEEVALLEEQLNSQNNETQAAEDTLREASKEMQGTQFEKKQVVQQWKSALIALQRRDEAYQAMLQTIHEKKEEERSIRAEIEGFKASCSKTQFASEKFVERKVRQEHAMKQIDANLALFEKTLNKLSEHFELLKKSLEQQDAEATKLKGMIAACNKELNGVQSQINLIDKQRHEAEQETTALLNDRITMSKAAKNLSREAGKIQKLVQDKEMEIAEAENEMSRIKIDKLNAKAHEEQLEQERDRNVQELEAQDRLIEKYKLEIRQRHDQIEKKMYVKDRLNRKIEQMMANVDEPENLGPLEATIKNLNKEIAALNNQNRELERHWLRLQTDFVNVVNEMEQESTTVQELESRDTISEQQKKRLDSRIRSQTAEFNDYSHRVERMHNDLHKLSELISEHKEKKEILTNANEVMQSDFVNELKELEKQSVEAESKIERIKIEKKALLDEILESERQIKLWEKKIQLEKETQAALDPTVGNAEVKAMEKEIHRMRIRYDHILKEQEKMIKEMEVGILKRETIATRKKGSVRSASGQIAKRKRYESDEAISEMTRAELSRKLNQMREEAHAVGSECEEYERLVSEEMQNAENMAMELEKASNVFAAVEDEIVSKKKQIDDALYQKQRNIESIKRIQQWTAKYVDFAKNPGIETSCSSEEVEILLDESQDQIYTIKQTIGKLGTSHPHLRHILERVNKLLENDE